MFSMVAVSGLSLLRNITMNSRNMLIIAISLGLGIGLNIVPEATQNLPRDIQLFLTSGVVPAGLVSIILDLCLPNNE